MHWTSPRASKEVVEAVGIAASAGGLHALLVVLGSLPVGFPVPILVVQHVDPHHRSLMALILGRKLALRVKEAEDGENARSGIVYVAAPGRHLVIGDDGRLATTLGPPVHYVRPAADVLFVSLAAACGPGAIGVVLSGMGADGADGVRALKRSGGTIVVEDPALAEFSGMPRAAVATGCADHVLPLEEIGACLASLVAREEPA